MENLKCKVCGSSDIIKIDGIFECRICGSQELVDSDTNPITQHQGFSKNKVIEIIEDAMLLTDSFAPSGRLLIVSLI